MQQKQTIIDYIKKNDGIVLVKAHAGTGKTYLLKKIAEETGISGIYIAYNKSIANEAKEKFKNTNISCCTAHSLAYQAVIKPHRYKIANLSYKDIDFYLPFEDKIAIIEDIKEFSLSRFLTYKDFVKSTKRKYRKEVIYYLQKMHKGEIPFTHDAYLKAFHIGLVDKTIEYDEIDILMLDEAGDVNEVILEIALNFPAKKKILVGDPYQNIYTFNHTINCFEVLQDKAVSFTLSKSYRVGDHIAQKVQQFCKKFISTDMEFSGIQLTDTTINTVAYLTRTNSELIKLMVEMNRNNTDYRIIRKASEIFKLPLMLASLKYQNTKVPVEFKHIQEAYDDWNEDTKFQIEHKNFFSYLLFLYSKDVQIKSAIRLLSNIDKGLLFDTYNEAKKREFKKANVTLATAHSVKGLEFDRVHIQDDLNRSIKNMFYDCEKGFNTPIKELPEDLKYELYLYYVAITRAIKDVQNAELLEISI